MSGQLTPAGWPRPTVGGSPVPWISPGDNLSTFDERRHSAAASGTVCAVCGMVYESGEECYLLYQGRAMPSADQLAERGGLESRVIAIDNGFMHRRCLLLALKHCPALGRLRAAGNLHCARTLWSCTQVPYMRRRTGLLQGYVLAADCRPVNLSLSSA